MLSEEEKARRGVIACLAYAELKNETSIFVGHQKVIDALKKKELEIGKNISDEQYISPEIATSELLSIQPEQFGDPSILRKNPYYSTPEQTEAAIKSLLDEKLILERRPNRVYRPRYKLACETLNYINEYDPVLAQNIASKRGLELPYASTNLPASSLEKKETDPNAPWAEHMKMAEKYADAICRKADWER